MQAQPVLNDSSYERDFAHSMSTPKDVQVTQKSCAVKSVLPRQQHSDRLAQWIGMLFMRTYANSL